MLKAIGNLVANGPIVIGPSYELDANGTLQCQDATLQDGHFSLNGIHYFLGHGVYEIYGRENLYQGGFDEIVIRRLR